MLLSLKFLYSFYKFIQNVYILQKVKCVVEQAGTVRQLTKVLGFMSPPKDKVGTWNRKYGNSPTWTFKSLILFSMIFERCQSRDVTSCSKMASGEGLAQPKMVSRESVKNQFPPCAILIFQTRHKSRTYVNRFKGDFLFN